MFQHHIAQNQTPTNKKGVAFTLQQPFLAY